MTRREDLERVTRINRHLMRNIDSEVMPLTLYRIEADLGLTHRRESPDAGRPWSEYGEFGENNPPVGERTCK